MQNLVPTSPIPPDFVHCGPEYGIMISSDCEFAGQGLPIGNSHVRFYTNNNPWAEFKLPLTVTHGTCTITVQLAGPPRESDPPFVEGIPNVIRGLAGYVIHSCSRGRPAGWNGGFVTNGLGRVQDYISDFELARADEAINLRFITVTVKGPNVQDTSPGDTSPRIPLIFANDLIDAASTTHHNSELRDMRYTLAQAIHDRGQKMMGQGGTWWEAASNPRDEMAYECDSNLGSPALVDCSQLQWQGFGSPSDSVQIGPGNPKSFSSNSCSIIVTAAVSVVLLVSQLIDAFATLLATCIDVPLSSPSGGRAYYGLHPTPSISIQEIFGQGKGKRDANGISGLNALPPHVNMTMFAHTGSANITCESQAAQQRRLVSSCETA